MKSRADPESVTRWAAVQGLFKIESKPVQALPVLIEGLKSPDEDRRLYAAKRLARFRAINAPSALVALESARFDINSQVRRAADYAWKAMTRRTPAGRDSELR